MSKKNNMKTRARAHANDLKSVHWPAATQNRLLRFLDDDATLC